jgi:hypothetical protein
MSNRKEDHVAWKSGPQLRMREFMMQCDPIPFNVSIVIHCHSHSDNGHLLYARRDDGILEYTSLHDVGVLVLFPFMSL